jgi:hypothetical protein
VADLVPDVWGGEVPEEAVPRVADGLLDGGAVMTFDFLTHERWSPFDSKGRKLWPPEHLPDSSFAVSVGDNPTSTSYSHPNLAPSQCRTVMIRPH